MADEIVDTMRHAARALRRSPGFTIAAILILALAIGAGTAVFSVVDTALLKPLPYPARGRLVVAQELRGTDQVSVAFPDYLDWRQQSHAFREVAAFTGWTASLTAAGEPERLRGALVSANLFATLGVHPLLGRAFDASEDLPAAPAVVAIGYDLWQRRFGGDPRIIGRAIPLNGAPATVIAVMPRGFRFPDGIVYGAADLWAPMSAITGPDRTSRDSHPGLVAIAALREGVSFEAGRADLAAVSAALQHDYPATNARTAASPQTAIDALVGDVRGPLWLLLGAVVLVLLMAVANVGGLIIARAAARRRDAAIRLALGADHRRAAAIGVAECAIIAVGGGCAGIVVASALVGIGRSLLGDLPRLDALAVDSRALIVAGLVSALIALAFGLAVSAMITDEHLEQRLRTRAGAAEPSTTRARTALIGGQLALAVVVLICASLLLKSFAQLVSQQGGIRPEGVMTFSVQPADASWPGGRKAALYQAIVDRLATSPGVSAAGAISVLPFSGSGTQSGIRPFGTAPGAGAERRTDVAAVTPAYFAAAGVDIVRGRSFGAQDDSASVPVAIVDEQFAATFWPGADPIGQRVAGWGFDALTIVGVARHVDNYGIASESREELYVPVAQRPAGRMTFAIRTAADPGRLGPVIRRTVRDIDPLLPVYNLRSMSSVVDATVSAPRLAATLVGGFGPIALLLTLLGTYSLVSYTVQRRTREIGVRMALGANQVGILRMVVAQTSRLAIAGIGAGVVAAFAASRLLVHQLYQVGAHDATIFVAVPLLLLAVTAGAGAIPAIRAARISPAIALDAE